ncbi:serine--tRNA ligase [Candidatus Peribacteria bacterium RIFCSPHIGHO2_02_FULL_49_16]|nr:MAG: serine--tRNA ligase [Candidatus Peribacteria bacterium RIFCSPHIGHO2_01_FULL_49_38]OGJ58674.1 MAG: serine--tRNA ligase [Candidatus Peribacteria bacterium RIFCSPHIGHO2_02_FULL_49_16]
MIDVTDLQNRPEEYQKAANVKGIDISVKEFLTLDELRRELTKRVDEMRAEKNAVSKKIPTMKDTEKNDAIADMKKLDGMLGKNEEQLRDTEHDWMNMLLRLPNIPHSDTPIGKDDRENVEVKQWPDPSTKLKVTPKGVKDHVQLGEDLDIIDIPRGVKIAGSRSYFLKGAAVQLELALLHYTLDHLIAKGFTAFAPPVLTHKDCLIGTGFFPGAEEQTYALKDDDLYLIGTSEVSVCSYHKDETLDISTLPKRYCGISNCFRREAGTYGKDTKGLYRVHQFQKVEQVILCEADEKKALELFEEIRTHAEDILQSLELPYRVVQVCTGDMGQGKVCMQDIETWMPSRNSYGETHSCSYLGDFQARRLNIKYTDGNGDRHFVHTINNTCIASPRILIPLIETYQNADGSITVPTVLRAYMGGRENIAVSGTL